jgi:hypothetical protein
MLIRHLITCSCFLPLFVSGCAEPVTLDPPSGAQSGEAHWLRFAHITDVHIVDEESPARVIRMEAVDQAAWRPQEAYAAHVLDATVQRLNELHEAGERPVDFLLVTGDLVDTGQYNELAWFLDVMEGRGLRVDSGSWDGVNRTEDPEDNPKLPFQATGLHPDIPWYAVLGNHDILANGLFGVNKEESSPLLWTASLHPLAADLAGFHALDLFQDEMWPLDMKSPAVVTGDGPPLLADNVQLDRDALVAGFIVPDADRHYLSPDLIMTMLNETDSAPQGHGFGGKDLNYTVRPVAGAPLRIVALNTSALEPPDGAMVHYGVLERATFDDFFKPAVQRARLMGELVIVVSHHPSEDFDSAYPDTVKALEFRNFMTSQTHVVAHVVGHKHIEQTLEISGVHSYVEILSPSLIEAPQEGRIFDLYYHEGNREARIEAAILSHMDAPTRLSSESHRLAELDEPLWNPSEKRQSGDAYSITIPCWTGEQPEEE